MHEKQNLLAETAKRVREEAGYTLEQVESNSGGAITDGYVSKIENGQAGDVTVTKLLALAKGLRVLPQLLLDAAQGEKPADTIHVNRAVAILRDLGEGDQKLAVRLIDVLRGAREEGGDSGGHGESRSGVPPIDRLASKSLGRKKGGKKREAS
jgi:transcriptional regulator with XRE-family HTH domain